MKSKHKYLFFAILFFFLKISNLYSNELSFEASEIQILDNGNKVKAIDGAEILTDDGVKINAEKFEYNKINLILIAEGNVKVFDPINQIIVNAPKIIYYKGKDIIVTEGKTTGTIKEIYNIATKNITINRKIKKITSKDKTLINDNDDNIFEIMEFIYLGNEKLIKGKKINFVNNTKDEFFFEDAFININNKEIIGRNIAINFHNSIFNNEKNEPRLKGNVAYSNRDSTKVSKGVFTTCKKRDGCPPWVISAKEVNHDKKKKTINYKNAWLKVYDLPVLYFPKFFHPDPTVKRQSGFLMPRFSDSKNLGSSLNVPYYYVISDSKDFTFKPKFYSDRKYILQSEFRTVTKNTKHTLDTSLMRGHESAIGDDSGNSRAHFFSNSIINFDLSSFDYSKLIFNFEKSSNDNYLKQYKLNSPLIKNYGYLNSYLDFEASNDDLSIKTSVQVYEDLNRIHSDRYEFIYPSFDISKNFNTQEKLSGNLSLSSSGYQKHRDTNVHEKIFINDFLYKSNPKISTNGMKNNYSLLLKNVNSESKNSSRYKTETEHQLLGQFLFETSYPLKKQYDESSNFLTPKISLRYSPTHTRNIKKEDRRIGINNIFSLNRIGSNDSVEGGQSITVGTEYKKIDKNDKEIFSLNLAKLYRNKVNEDLPIKSTIGNKDSDVVGNLRYSPNKYFKINYDFSLDNNLDTSNFNLIKTEIKINNFATNFEYLEENNLIGKESYIENKTAFNFNDSNSIGFSTRKNKKTNLTEFYNLIYQYKNDCLIAAVEYNKEYYENNEIKPEEQIFFSLTIVPFGKVNSPNINQ